MGERKSHFRGHALLKSRLFQLLPFPDDPDDVVVDVGDFVHPPDRLLQLLHQVHLDLAPHEVRDPGALLGADPADAAHPVDVVGHVEWEVVVDDVLGVVGVQTPGG